VGIKLSPRVAAAIREDDELTWQVYLGMIHEYVNQHNNLPNVSQDSEA
jgi:hypothetical protein